MLPARTALPAPDSLADEEIVARVVAGERPLFELIMRRHNERVYRAVRSILRDETEAEDAMQQAYVDAFQHLGEFAGRSRFSTWLTRIAIHEALARRRSKKSESEGEELMASLPDSNRNPEQQAYGSEMQRVLTAAIDELPEHFRTVFVLRAVQGLSIEETAQALDIAEQTVKTRLHRARGLLKRVILQRTEPELPQALPFPAVRCDRVVKAVLDRIGARA